MAQNEQTISWVVDTHEHKDRTVDWYWTVGLVAVCAAGLSIFFSNVLLAIIILLGASSVAVLVARGPRQHWVNIDSRGISLDGTLYPYRSVHSFWVEHSANPRLLVSTTGLISPQIIIPLNEVARAQSVRIFLKKFAEEEEQDPHIGQHMAELIGL